jgi:hypothetical protein
LPLIGTLLGISITGGMFIVPLYAFLTTVVEKCEAARTIAANNIVNSAAMLVGSLLAMGLTAWACALSTSCCSPGCSAWSPPGSAGCSIAPKSPTWASVKRTPSMKWSADPTQPKKAMMAMKQAQ